MKLTDLPNPIDLCARLETFKNGLQSDGRTVHAGLIDVTLAAYAGQVLALMRTTHDLMGAMAHNEEHNTWPDYIVDSMKKTVPQMYRATYGQLKGLIKYLPEDAVKAAERLLDDASTYIRE